MRRDHHPLSEYLSGSGFPSPLNGWFIHVHNSLIATFGSAEVALDRLSGIGLADGHAFGDVAVTQA